MFSGSSYMHGMALILEVLNFISQVSTQLGNLFINDIVISKQSNIELCRICVEQEFSITILWVNILRKDEIQWWAWFMNAIATIQVYKGVYLEVQCWNLWQSLAGYISFCVLVITGYELMNRLYKSSFTIVVVTKTMLPEK